MGYNKIIILIVIIYIYTFIDGVHDGCNVIATIISSRSMKPEKAICIAALSEFAAPLFLGTAVASTVGKGIVSTSSMQSKGTGEEYLFILCAIIGAILWNLITWKLSLPSSSSHALIGGLLGSGIIAFGFNSIMWKNLFFKVILMIFLTPAVGFVVGFIMMRLMKYLCKNCNNQINVVFKKLQLVGMVFLAASHSMNDSQNTMGVVTLALVITGVQSEFYVPFWVKIISSLLLAIGLTMSGWKIVKTVGRGIFKMKPAHSFVSQVSAASVICTSAALGSPVSASQIISSSIMGIGASEKMSAVRWNTAKNIILSWITTIPAAASISMFLYYIVHLF